jgi:hypothetical protein
MARDLQLTQGKIAVVDDGDYEWLRLFKWRYTSGGYAVTTVGDTLLRMHRVLLFAPHYFQVDHIDGDRLNNQRSNLRLCTRKQNSANRRNQANNKSGFKGVRWHKKHRRWYAHIQASNRLYHLGNFATAEHAALAYDAAALRLFGAFARLNFPKVN